MQLSRWEKLSRPCVADFFKLYTTEEKSEIGLSRFFS